MMLSTSTFQGLLEAHRVRSWVISTEVTRGTEGTCVPIQIDAGVAVTAHAIAAIRADVHALLVTSLPGFIDHNFLCGVDDHGDRDVLVETLVRDPDPVPAEA
jgi:hypothetical protein